MESEWRIFLKPMLLISLKKKIRNTSGVKYYFGYFVVLLRIKDISNSNFYTHYIYLTTVLNKYMYPLLQYIL